MKVLKFETRTCVPCKILDMMLDDKGFKVDEKIDIESDEDTREKYNVMSSPTLILLDDDNKEIHRVTGIDEDGVVDLFSNYDY